MFSARGVQVWNRNEHGGWHNTQNLTRLTPSRKVLAAIAEKIDEVFGTGAAEEAIKVSGKSKTVLVDGGGVPMPLPNRIRAQLTRASYDEIKPDWRADLRGEAQVCRQCGKQLRLDTDHHRLGSKLLENHPRTVEDCQKLTNRRIVAVHGYGTQRKDLARYISWFETWDGESYIDVSFCSDSCAARYGRRAVGAYPALEIGGDLDRKTHRVRDDVEHYTPEESRTFTLSDGREIKV